MSVTLPKNKKKRTRSDANNSLVKNITSKVSGLLPATITKWFSSPTTSNANGSAPTAEVTDSSSDDEPESPAPAQPPPKRMRYSHGILNSYDATDSNCTSNSNFEQCNRYNTVQSPPGTATFRMETNFVSTPVRSPDEGSAIERAERDKTPHSVSPAGHSGVTSRKSLFGEDSPAIAEASMRACVQTSLNTSKNPKDPYFKPSLLGSPFYPGRTMYGGVAASYINQPNIKQRKTTLVNETNSEDNSMSYTAKRIMDLLEHYSSPLKEAKRIPQYVSSMRDKESGSNSSVHSLNPNVPKVLSYKTQELHVPYYASILRFKKRSRLMDSTSAARQIIASHSSAADCMSYPSDTQSQGKDTGNKLTTKVKSRLTRPKRSEDLETNIPAPPNFTSAVLPIDKDSLPKFSFGFTSVTNTQSSWSSKAVTAATNTTLNTITTSNCDTKMATAFKTPETSADKAIKFTSPVTIPFENLKSKTPPVFNFKSPERDVEKNKNVTKKVSVCEIKPATSSEANKKQSNNWQCSDCWVFNKTDVDKCICCGGKRPINTAEDKSVKCAICKLADRQTNSEKCVNCDKVQVNIGKRLSFKQDTDKWKCDDCWVNNDGSAAKCVACGGKRPGTASVQKETATAEWTCDICWIKNKDSLDKCAACGGAKPGKKSETPNPSSNSVQSTVKLTENTLKSHIRSKKDSWECPICLVVNENDKSRCVCCETERSTPENEACKKIFQFGKNENAFKFGIDNKEVDAPKLKEIEAKSAEAKVEESETNNNVLPTTPKFNFGVPAKKSEDQTEKKDSLDANKDKTVKPTQVTFKFGIPNQSSAPAPVFGAAEKPVDSTPKIPSEDKEKAQEVPTVDLNQSAPKSLPNMFASPLTSQPKDVPKASPIQSPSLNLEKKDTFLTSKPNAAEPEAKAQKTFSFSGIGIKPAVNLFGSATASPATTGVSFAAPQSTVTPVTSVSLFQKSDDKVVSMFKKTEQPQAIPLFQKSDVTTASPAPIAPAAPITTPIFGFGSQTGQSEKPKFSTTFGSAKSESLFKPTFGTTESTSAPNAFALPTGNALAAGSGPGNPLGGNGLPAANILPGNALSAGNGLPVSPMGGTNGPTSLIAGATGSSLQTGISSGISPGIFGSTVQKENLWSATNNTSGNLFTNQNNMQSPGAFSFNYKSASTANQFGSNSQQPSQLFGMQFNNQFPANQTTPNAFGQPVNNASGGVFGSNMSTPTPSFTAPNPTMQPYEAPSLIPVPTPTFNFGAKQMFGQQQTGPSGVYNFGASSPGMNPPQVQFNMGMGGTNPAPNTMARRVKKAARRNPQR